MTRGQKTKTILIRLIGFLISLGLISWLIANEFIMIDVALKYKATFGGLLITFILFIVFGGWLNGKINRKLQSVDTVEELGEVGKSNPLIIEIYKHAIIVIPIALVGGMFYFVGTIFTNMGYTMLKIAGVLLIPIITGTISKTVERGYVRQNIEDEKQGLIRAIVDETEKRTKVGYR